MSTSNELYLIDYKKRSNEFVNAATEYVSFSIGWYLSLPISLLISLTANSIENYNKLSYKKYKTSQKIALVVSFFFTTGIPFILFANSLKNRFSATIISFFIIIIISTPIHLAIKKSLPSFSQFGLYTTITIISSIILFIASHFLHKKFNNKSHPSEHVEDNNGTEHIAGNDDLKTDTNHKLFHILTLGVFLLLCKISKIYIPPKNNNQHNSSSEYGMLINAALGTTAINIIFINTLAFILNKNLLSYKEEGILILASVALTAIFLILSCTLRIQLSSKQNNIPSNASEQSNISSNTSEENNVPSNTSSSDGIFDCKSSAQDITWGNPVGFVVNSIAFTLDRARDLYLKISN